MPDLCPVKVVALAEHRTRLDCTPFCLEKIKHFFPLKRVMCWGCRPCLVVLRLQKARGDPSVLGARHAAFGAFC